MANSMQNITNETFTDTSSLIWVRVGNKFAKSARDAAANNQPLPGCWFGNSRHQTANEQFSSKPAVEIKIMIPLTLATANKNL